MTYNPQQAVREALCFPIAAMEAAPASEILTGLVLDFLTTPEARAEMEWVVMAASCIRWPACDGRASCGLSFAHKHPECAVAALVSWLKGE